MFTWAMSFLIYYNIITIAYAFNSEDACFFSPVISTWKAGIWAKEPHAINCSRRRTHVYVVDAASCSKNTA